MDRRKRAGFWLTIAVAAGILSAAAAPPLPLMEDGVMKSFEISTNEVHLKGRHWDRVAAEPSGPQKRDANIQEEHVLYEAGKPPLLKYRRILTKRVSAQLSPESNPKEIAIKSGATSFVKLPVGANNYIFVAGPGRGSALGLAETLKLIPGVESATPLLGRHSSRKSLPNDPLFEKQWTLFNTGQSGGTPGADANVTPVWPDFRGQGVMVAVVDDGVQYTHPDLAANTRKDLGFDYRDNDDDPAPALADGILDPMAEEDPHGTCVAGVIAASGNNGIGVAGAAYEATIIPIRLIGGDNTDEQDALSMVHRKDVVQISNNSWGNAPDDGRTMGGAGPLFLQALEDGANLGRGGRGVIYVWAAGNGGESDDNANNDTQANSIYTIAVGALTDLGTRASYSEAGACLVVSAPSGEDLTREAGTFTTDLMGTAGFNTGDGFFEDLASDYTGRFNGTSASTPLVSGCIALMLQANPDLGWRDVQDILIRTASKTDPGGRGWLTNRAGLHFNHDFGAGRVDAAAAVAAARNHQKLKTAYVDRQALYGFPVAGHAPASILIPNGLAKGVTNSFTFRSDLQVEHVTVDCKIDQPSRGEVDIQLVSPSGTTSDLFVHHDDPNRDINHRFMSVFNWGESSKGVWKVIVRDTIPGNVGTIRDITVNIHGTLKPGEKPPAAITLIPGRFSSDVFNYTLESNAGGRVRLDKSTDLINWTPGDTITLTNQTTVLTDSQAKEGSLFYRAVRVD